MFLDPWLAPSEKLIDLGLAPLYKVRVRVRARIRIKVRVMIRVRIRIRIRIKIRVRARIRIRVRIRVRGKLPRNPRQMTNPILLKPSKLNLTK